MSEPLILTALFGIGVIASYFGNFTSGGIGSISIGLMTLIGFSPQMSGAIFKIGKIGSAISGLIVHKNTGTIPKDIVLGAGLGLMFGAFIGSYLLFSVPDWLIYGVSGCTMLIVAIISLHKKHIETRGELSLVRKRVGYGMYFFMSILGNIFLAGSGVWYYFVNVHIFRLTAIETRALTFATNPFWTIGSLAGLYVAGGINILYSLTLALGMFVGGYFSAKHLLKIGNKLLQKMLLCSVILLAIYFIYLAITLYR